jgi:hypothetical protein
MLPPSTGCRCLHPEDGSSIVLRNFVILPHHYTASRAIIPQPQKCKITERHIKKLCVSLRGEQFPFVFVKSEAWTCFLSPTTGARVVIACRDLKKAEKAAEDIRRDASEVDGAGHIVVVELDLSSVASVRRCAQHLLRTERQINILVNNAGKPFVAF